VRGRRRDQLRAEIAREQSTIRLSDEKLVSLKRDMVEAKGPRAIESRVPNAERRPAQQRDTAVRRPGNLGVEL
jgi:hypothetical protein